jgi:hypothetical protein
MQYNVIIVLRITTICCVRALLLLCTISAPFHGQYAKGFEFQPLMSLGCEMRFNAVTPCANALVAESTDEGLSILTVNDNHLGDKVCPMFGCVFLNSLPF